MLEVTLAVCLLKSIKSDKHHQAEIFPHINKHSVNTEMELEVKFESKDFQVHLRFELCACVTVDAWAEANHRDGIAINSKHCVVSLSCWYVLRSEGVLTSGVHEGPLNSLSVHQLLWMTAYTTTPRPK